MSSTAKSSFEIFFSTIEVNSLINFRSILEEIFPLASEGSSQGENGNDLDFDLDFDLDCTKMEAHQNRLLIALDTL